MQHAAHSMVDQDLEKLIQLDVVSFDLFDMQPLSEYDRYIRNFGQSGTRQSGCQTNEDEYVEIFLFVT